jgi:hypothetical protein
VIWLPPPISFSASAASSPLRPSNQFPFAFSKPGTSGAVVTDLQVVTAVFVVGTKLDREPNLHSVELRLLR